MVMSNTCGRLLRNAALLAAVVALSGCATLGTVIGHSDLEVSTKMSSSVFLMPMAKSERTVFLQFHNTTDKGRIGIEPALRKKINARGWQIVSDPERAKVIVQVNVLQAGEMSPSALEASLAGGYGSVVGSAAVGAGATAVAGGSGRAVAGAGLLVGAADFIGGLMVENVTISVITDIRLLQRGEDGETFKTHHNVGAASGSQSGNLQQRILTAILGGSTAATSTGSNVSTSTRQSYTTESEFMIHQTRVVSYANQANLTWKEAEPKLKDGLVNVLSGLF